MQIINNRKTKSGKPDSVRMTVKKVKEKRTVTVFGDSRFSSGHVLNITSEIWSQKFTFKRMLSM